MQINNNNNNKLHAYQQTSDATELTKSFRVMLVCFQALCERLESCNYLASKIAENENILLQSKFDVFVLTEANSSEYSIGSDIHIYMLSFCEKERDEV